MRYELRVAARHLMASRLQSTLILLGVVVGIVAFTFMAALINGLADSLTDNVIGNLAHITLEPPDREPAYIGLESVSFTPLVAVQRLTQRRESITSWRSIAELTRDASGVRDVAPEVSGSGLVQRGAKRLPIAIKGVPIDKLSSTIDVESGLVEGELIRGPSDVLIGVRLAEELGVAAGQRIRIESDRNRERWLLVRGVFDVGSASVNERVLFMELRTAQSLMELPGSVTKLEVKVDDIYDAPRIADALGRLTGLEAKDWIAENRRLQDALRAQGSTGSIIKVFSLLTILIGVASVLMLTAVRRRSEVGIMRSFGVSRRSIEIIFILQGLLIGAVGSVSGSAIGWAFCHVLMRATLRPDGTSGLPIDPAQGEYWTAIALATAAGGIAAILPARAAARVDPVEVIQQ